SDAVGRLEQELGARLYVRAPTGIRLTAAGEAFVGPARRALTEADSGKAAVGAITGVLSGELRVVGIRTAVVETAQLVAEFHRDHPGVRVIIEEPAHDRAVVELVRSGRCDVGILRTGEVPKDLPAVPAGTRDIVVIFPHDAAALHNDDTPQNQATTGERNPVTTESLSGVPFVAPLPGTSA
nr:LysR family transcriptional regulator [Micromonospora sp. DSM 115978]